MSGGTGRTVLGASTATLISRIIGFVRNICLAAALGTGLVSDSYNLANQIPNQIFLLLGGGTIAAVFLPQLARLSARSQKDADRYASFLLVGAALFGLLLSGTAVFFAPQIVGVLGGSVWEMTQRDLTVALFVWCAPQIAAYAVFAVASQLMNARGKFALVSWLPAASSLFVIAGSAIVIINGSVQGDNPSSVGAGAVIALGATTLGGMLVQTGTLLVLLRGIGFRPSLRGGVRGLGLKAAFRIGALTLASATCYQLTNLLTAAWTAQAGTSATKEGYDGFGYSAFFYAMALVSVVQGVAVGSLASILLQRMSKHFAAGEEEAAYGELDDAILRLSAFIIPLAAVLVACGPAISEILFARGQTSPTAARMIGVVLALLAVGLLPFALHSILIRPFYARHDAMRPLLSSFSINAIWALGAILAFMLLPSRFVVFGMALTFSIAYWVDLPVKLRLLQRRLLFRIDHGIRSDIFKAILTSVALVILIGTPGWAIFFSVNIATSGALLIGMGQAILILVLYTAAVRSSRVSPIALLRWLRM